MSCFYLLTGLQQPVCLHSLVYIGVMNCLCANRYVALGIQQVLRIFIKSLLFLLSQHQDSQLVPKSTRTPKIVPKLTRTEVNLYPSQLVPRSTRTQVNSYQIFIVRCFDDCILLFFSLPRSENNAKNTYQKLYQ